ncbi:MAG: GLPGLI family protein [Bacteroidota bacterium]
MKRLIPAIAALVLLSATARAQFTTVGKIEFERKVNVYAQMEEMEENEWFERIKSQIPKFSSTYFDLVFDSAHSLYKPGREPETPPVKMWGGGPATDNIVYSDFAAKRVSATKIVFEQKFLVQDSIRKMDWKAKEEIRTIAGYKCHKAVGRICDSVYVVAFYTEDIVVNGGPEMFGGLPGMILELAIPRLHTTWVATKVDMVTPKAADFTAPEKGKKVTGAGLYQTIKDSFKDWGKSAARNIWWAML